MVTLEDVSSQLMKPAKDLADWNFPLSQVLEKYYALIEQPRDINFGNAGLVIENSTSVYSRRVDHLSEKTLGLNLTIEHEFAESAKTKQESKKKNKRLPVDLEDFVPHDLTKEIGKNINFKGGSQKPVKLISRRFPQLESSLVHLHNPVNIVDISGEIIGKKYNFRCNEYFDVNGMLVYECTEDDFKRGFMNRSSNDQSISCTESCMDRCIETDSDPLESSGYYSCTSTTACSHISNEDFNDCSASVYDNSCVSPIVEDDIDYDLANVDSVSVHSSENVVIDHSDIPTENGNRSTNNTASDNEIVVKSCDNSPLCEKELGVVENQLAEHGRNNDSAENRSDATTQSLDENSSMSVQHEAQCKENRVDLKNINKGTKTCDSNMDKISSSEDLSSSRRRSKRISNMRSNMREMKSEAWKPIPLTKGGHHKPVKKRAQFKLPSQISSSKSVSETRKRKLSESRKSECLVKFYLNEFELPNKKVTMYSPTRQTFTPLKQEELEEFQKSFDDCFKTTNEEFQQTDYEAVTNITMDLLGFQPSYIDTKKDPIFDHIMYSPGLSIPDSRPLSSADSTVYPSPPSYSTPEASPSPHNDLLRADSPPILPNSSDYQKLIENRMKEIFNESDVRTDLEEAVAKWHSVMRPKLVEAERRAVFNIREYSARILNVLRTIERRKCTFNSLVDGQEPFEVARYFSAILQLANANSVDIRTNNGHMELVLLRADFTSDCTEEEAH